MNGPPTPTIRLINGIVIVSCVLPRWSPAVINLFDYSLNKRVRLHKASSKDSTPGVLKRRLWPLDQKFRFDESILKQLIRHAWNSYLKEFQRVVSYLVTEFRGALYKFQSLIELSWGCLERKWFQVENLPEKGERIFLKNGFESIRLKFFRKINKLETFILLFFLIFLRIYFIKAVHYRWI